MILDNPLPDRSIVHRRIRKALDQPNLPHRDLVAGDSFYLTKDVDGHAFYPSRLSLASTADDQSIVLQVRIGTVARVLLLSDSGSATENALLRSGVDLRSDILVKGQHHSSPSGSAAFLEAVKPRLIIATSRDFPENERIKDDWVEEVQRRGIRLLRQDETGLSSYGSDATAGTRSLISPGKSFGARACRSVDLNLGTAFRKSFPEIFNRVRNYLELVARANEIGHFIEIIVLVGRNVQSPARCQRDYQSIQEILFEYPALMMPSLRPRIGKEEMEHANGSGGQEIRTP